MHFDGNHAVALARLAAAALYVEREPAGPEAASLGVGHHRKEIPDEGEQPGVRRRIAARRAPDWRLIDLDHFVDQVDPVDPIVRAGVVARPIERLGERLVQDVIDEGRLPGAAHAGHRRQHAQRNPDIEVLEIIRAGAADDHLALQFRSPRLGRRDRAGSRQIGAGQRKGDGSLFPTRTICLLVLGAAAGNKTRAFFQLSRFR